MTKIINKNANIFLMLLLLFLTNAAQAFAENFQFSSLDGRMNVSGELYLPTNLNKPVPAMIVVHGTGGIDTRTKYFADELPKSGIAVLVVDFKTGIFTSPSNRPPNDSFQPAAFAALNLLRSNPKIDHNKIGIMGFSLGGQLTMTTALKENVVRWLGTGKVGFRLHVAYYPGCKYFLNKLNSNSIIEAPVKVFYGTYDTYGDGEFCPKLKEEIKLNSSKPISFVAYEGAHHGFDGNQPAKYYDPAAINGNGIIEPNEKYKNASRSDAIAWINRYIK
jgi:uncharacterized protein